MVSFHILYFTPLVLPEFVGSVSTRKKGSVLGFAYLSFSSQRSLALEQFLGLDDLGDWRGMAEILPPARDGVNSRDLPIHASRQTARWSRPDLSEFIRPKRYGYEIKLPPQA